jgi:hypothetical protein
MESKKYDWSISYPYFSQIINLFQLKVGAEIGVAFGGHSEAILKQTEVIKLYGIDSYTHRDNYHDSMNFPQPEFEKLFHQVQEKLKPYGTRFQLIRSDSKDAVNLIKEQLDFVYIDAEHTYQAVRLDISNWYPIVRNGGVVGGHDYQHPYHPGVKQAVDEFFKPLGLKINLEGDGVWWVQKSQ